MYRRELTPKNLTVCVNLKLKVHGLKHSQGNDSFYMTVGMKPAKEFESNEGIRNLDMQGEWYMDGTFNTAPKLFKQLYVIPARLGQSAVTCAYAQIKGKSQELYEEMLQANSRAAEALGFTLDPESVHLDFERPVFSAVKNTFGSHMNKKGCFYHLTQSIWCKVQDLGLSSLYKEDSDFRHFCGMIDGLAFHPGEDVEEGMAYLKDNVPYDGAPLLDYFDVTYVPGTYRTIRCPAENGSSS